MLDVSIVKINSATFGYIGILFLEGYQFCRLGVVVVCTELSLFDLENIY